jgi:MFS family permease
MPCPNPKRRHCCLAVKPKTDRNGMKRELTRLIAGQVFLHACMAGMRMATPLLALKLGYSALAVGALLALFALTQVFLALPAGRYADRKGLKKPLFISG